MATCRVFDNNELKALQTEFGSKKFNHELLKINNPKAVLTKMRATRPYLSSPTQKVLVDLAHGLPYIPMFFCFDDNWETFFAACQYDTELAFRFLPLAIASASQNILAKLLPEPGQPLAKLLAEEIESFITKLLTAVSSLSADTSFFSEWLARLIAYALLNLPNDKEFVFTHTGFFGARFNNFTAWNIYCNYLDRTHGLPSLPTAERLLLEASSSGNLTILDRAIDLFNLSYFETLKTLAPPLANFSNNLPTKTLPTLLHAAFFLASRANQTEMMRYIVQRSGLIALTPERLETLLIDSTLPTFQFCCTNRNILFTPMTRAMLDEITLRQVASAASHSLAMLKAVNPGLAFDQTCLERAGCSGEIACVDYILANAPQLQPTANLLRQATLSGNPRLVEHILKLAAARDIKLSIEDLVVTDEESVCVFSGDTPEMQQFIREQVEVGCDKNTQAALALRCALKMDVPKVRLSP